VSLCNLVTHIVAVHLVSRERRRARGGGIVVQSTRNIREASIFIQCIMFTSKGCVCWCKMRASMITNLMHILSARCCCFLFYFILFLLFLILVIFIVIIYLIFFNLIYSIEVIKFVHKTRQQLLQVFTRQLNVLRFVTSLVSPCLSPWF
jgi:hypothetical protein